MVKKYFVVTCLVLLTACGGNSSDSDDVQEEVKFETKELLGKALFSDKNLSFARTQSCATCHNPEHGFVDERKNSPQGTVSAFSLGDDGVSRGDRNAPTAGYAHLSPVFFNGESKRPLNKKLPAYKGYIGGQFWDGRAATLADQAKGPPTNPAEMAMADKASVVQRIKDNNDYVLAFERLYGADVFNSAEVAYDKMADSIAAFESTAAFSPFDSKFDKSVQSPPAYVYKSGSLAKRGKDKFGTGQFNNCASCHQLNNVYPVAKEVFTSFEYHNIGVPGNGGKIDVGLSGIDALKQDADKDLHKGKFKVPTLRNVAVTAPYMHNGVFNSLETVVAFYEHARKRSAHEKNPASPADTSHNPETNQAWEDPEINMNISLDELAMGEELTNQADDNIQKALVCFMMTLTDARYEHLLDAAKVKECGI